MDVTNRQRAFWMVLITSLAAPFFASLSFIAFTVVARFAGLDVIGNSSLSLGEAGIAAFAWSAMPATISALGLTPYVLDKGGYGWLQAAIAGVLSFGVSAVIAPFNAGPFMSLLAFFAGVIAIGVREMLLRGGILKV